AASGGEDGDGASRAAAATRRGVASRSGGATRCSIAAHSSGAARSGGAARSSGATAAGPRSVEIKDLRRERYATRIEPDRVVDADEEVGELPRQRGRAAGGAVGGQAPGLVVEHLRGEDAGLELDDLSHLSCGRRILALSVDQRRVDRLALEAGLAAVPHARAEEPEVGTRQRPTINRDNPGRRAGQAGVGVGRAVVGIVHVRTFELGVGGNLHPDPDQAGVGKQLVGLLPLRRGAPGVGGAGGAAAQPKEWLRPATLREPSLYPGRADAPSLLRLMAAQAGPAVGSEVLKEGIVRRGRGAARLEG